MLVEVQIAAEFITRLLAQDRLDQGRRQQFLLALKDAMLARFQSHWDPQSPLTGSAFRSISAFGTNRADPLVREAAEQCGIGAIESLLPAYFVLWCDPGQVAYRLGSDRSQILVVYEDPLLADLHGVSKASARLSPIKSSPLKVERPSFRPGPQRLLFA